MKEGWNSGTFADIFDLQMGKTPSRDNPSFWGGDNIWVSIADMNCGKFIYDTKEHISDLAVSQSGIHLVKKNTVIMSFKLSIGKTAIATKDLYTNEAIMSFNIKDGFNILPTYIYYYLKGYKWQGMNKAVMGMTLNKKTISNNIFSYPTIPLQQHIVEELDLLSSIIEKKKAQLKELDNLAQSLFYEMFGDPITNENGWEVKKIGEIAESKIGVTYKPTDVNDNGIIVLRSSNIQNSEIDLEDIVRVNCIIKDEKYVRDGDILMCTRNGSFRLVGKVALINNLPERMTYGAFMTIIRSQYNDFLFMFFQLPAFRQQLATAQTATINQITVKMLNDVKVIVPPLDLQNQFASKIEAIEHQKELIKQSIKEVETLFNSRMDYYFN